MEFKRHQNLDTFHTNNGSKIKETARRQIYSAGYSNKSLADVKKVNITKKHEPLITKNSFHDLNKTNKLLNTPLPRLLDMYHNQVSQMKSMSCNYSNFTNSELTYFSSINGPR